MQTNKFTFASKTEYGANFNCSIYGGGRFRELECCYNDIVLAIVCDPNQGDQYRGVVDLLTWSVRDVLL